jgi:AraC-like DNA-binding protein
MAEGAYRETGLTISSLASGLNHPEHQLRRLINGHLGFRNFTAFLNSYRIKEAQERLSDLDRVRVPVLTTALDLGYGSLGPFNRAFKESTGMTPTEFRQQSLSNANSE